MKIDLHLLSWNLHGVPSAPRVWPRLRRSAAEILRRRPAVVLLQEIRRPRDADFLVAQFSGQYLRVDAPPGGLLGRAGGLMGLVLRASGFRIEGSSFEPYQAHAPGWKFWQGDGLSEKGIQRIDLDYQGQRLVLLNSHLQASYGPGGYSEIRRAQLRQLARAAARIDAALPVVAAGDLNTRPEEEIYSEIDATFRDLATDFRHACACGTVSGRPQWIDYVLLRRGGGWEASAAIELIRSPQRDVPFSDHHGIDARISLSRVASGARRRRQWLGKTLRGPSSRRDWLRAVARLARPLLSGFAFALTISTAGGAPVRAAPDPDAGPGLGLTSLDSESARSPGRLLETPLSISVVEAEAVREAGPAIEIEAALQGVPGVFAQSSLNFAQDPRISIRGFGARSTFGVRGIRVLVDGVPNTLPDGQTELDSIDLGFVDRIEVVRGPISSLYGGGGGGVVMIETAAPSLEPRIRARTLFGSDQLFRQEALYTGTHAKTGVVAALGFTNYGGYREHARARQTNLLTKFERTLPDGTELRLNFSAVWAPEAQDPGGLRASEVAEDRTQAAPFNLAQDASEKLDQQKLSLALARPLPGDNGELRAWFWALRRDFSNKLPIPSPRFGQVDLERRVGGGSVVLDYPWGRSNWLIGIDVDIQRDRRRRYENIDGARGDLGLDQHETVRTIGPFAQVDLDLGDGFGLVAGARYDWTEFKVDDDFSGHGDQSARIHFRALSPRFGLRFRRSPAFHAYANLTTGFQVPTTTQLAPATGIGGFDPDIDPERTVGFEIGAKGAVAERFAYELAVFSLEVRDLIVPFTDESDQTFARNAAKAHRLGLEAASSLRLRQGLVLRTSYTYSDFVYRDYETREDGAVQNFDGNREPNVPVHSFAGQLRWEHRSGLRAVLSARYFSDLEVDDANTATSGGALISDLRVGTRFSRGDLEFRPFLGVRNWTGVKYNGTIRPNARFGRYYEPAPRSEIFGGWEIRWL
ncbi:MAG: TonB-dependent receptor [Myxococcales bacterium]|nr:TonB-dependent receptor [Myxococcales bacterium]